VTRERRTGEMRIPGLNLDFLTRDDHSHIGLRNDTCSVRGYDVAPVFFPAVKILPLEDAPATIQKSLCCRWPLQAQVGLVIFVALSASYHWLVFRAVPGPTFYRCADSYSIDAYVPPDAAAASDISLRAFITLTSRKSSRETQRFPWRVNPCRNTFPVCDIRSTSNSSESSVKAWFRLRASVPNREMPQWQSFNFARSLPSTKTASGSSRTTSANR
jgi:hypothetical protein